VCIGHPTWAAKRSALAAQYGELLPEGVDKMLDAQHLDGRNGAFLLDLGMGLGKLAIQAWLQFPNLEASKLF
jgi:hypothetical protein